MNIQSLKKIAGIPLSAAEKAVPLMETSDPDLVSNKGTNVHVFDLLKEGFAKKVNDSEKAKILAEYAIWKTIIKQGLEISEDDVSNMVKEQEKTAYLLRIGGANRVKPNPSASELLAEHVIKADSTESLSQVINALVEYFYDDDDDYDLSDSEKELIAAAEKDLKKSGVVVKNFDADKLVGTKQAKKKEDEEEEKQKESSKKQLKEGEIISHLQEKLSTNITRKEFINYAKDVIGIKPVDANNIYHMVKKNLNEAYVLTHKDYPQMQLHENRELNIFEWVDSSDSKIPLYFDSEESAKKIKKYMSEWKGQAANIQKITLS